MPKDAQLVMFPVRKKARKVEQERDHWRELHDRMTSGPAPESHQPEDLSAFLPISDGVGPMPSMRKFLVCLLGTLVGVVGGGGLVIWSLFQWQAGHQWIAAPMLFLAFCIVYAGSAIMNLDYRPSLFHG